MKITDVQTTLLTGPSTNDPFFREARKTRSAAFIEIHTDTELTGLGETYAGYFCPEAVPAIVEFFKPILIGQTVDDINELWARMYRCGQFWCRVGLGTSVLTGIEAALWDLRGKAEQLPVYKLLGGSLNNRLPAYATGGPSNYPIEKLVRKLEHYRSLGFTAVKIGAGAYTAGDGWKIEAEPESAAGFEVAKVEAIRCAFGMDLQIMLDAHMDNSPKVTWTLPVALAVAKALESYDLLFLEEPLPYTDAAAYAELAQSTSVAIAGGECLTGFCEWKVFIEQNCFDIGQPDASFTGGLGEFMRIAHALADRGRRIATHAWGAGPSLMQNIHCAFATANTAILEVAPDFGPLHSETILDGAFVLKDGFVLRPEQPGLGIRLSDETRSRYPFRPGTGEFNSVPGKLLGTD